VHRAKLIQGGHFIGEKIRVLDPPADYPCSSYQFNGVGRAISLITPHQECLALGGTAKARLLAYRSLFRGVCSKRILQKLMNLLIKDGTLGCDRFKKKIEKPLAESDCSMVAIESQRFIRIKYSAPLIRLVLMVIK